MRPSLLLLLAAVLLTHCNRKTVPSLPSVKTEDVSAPANTEVTVPAGSNLQDIADKTYGHASFSGFIAQLNEIKSPERIVTGAILKTPSLAVGLRDAGLDPTYQPAINVLAQTWNQLRKLLPEYERQRNALPANLQTKLLKCADQMDAAIDVLGHPKQGHRVPQSTLGQFSEAAISLRNLAAGIEEDRDYDVFMIGKRIGLGFTYTLIWAKSGHR
jgi:hypothetical protein